MSQSPYSPYSAYATPGYGHPPQDVMAPARRAGVLMFITAALTFLSALCCAGTGALLPHMMSQQPSAFSELQQQVPEATPQLLRATFFVMSGFSVLLAAGTVVLGIFVRRGSKGAIVTSIVLCALGIICFILWTAMEVVRSSQAAGSRGPGAICVTVLPLVLLSILLICLIQALRSAGAVKAMREAYAQQYWQYAYQQQMYQQGGGPAAGYAQPNFSSPNFSPPGVPGSSINNPPAPPSAIYPSSTPPPLPPADSSPTPPRDSAQDSNDRPDQP